MSNQSKFNKFIALRINKTFSPAPKCLKKDIYQGQHVEKSIFSFQIPTEKPIVKMALECSRQELGKQIIPIIVENNKTYTMTWDDNVTSRIYISEVKKNIKDTLTFKICFSQFVKINLLSTRNTLMAGTGSMSFTSPLTNATQIDMSWNHEFNIQRPSTTLGNNSSNMQTGGSGTNIFNQQHNHPFPNHTHSGALHSHNIQSHNHISLGPHSHTFIPHSHNSTATHFHNVPPLPRENVSFAFDDVKLIVYKSP